MNADAEKLRMMCRSRERTVRKYLKSGSISAEQADAIRAKTREMLEMADALDERSRESTDAAGKHP